jgi:sarcosine oxidase
VAERWPALSLPEGTLALHQADTSIVPAGRSTATMQGLARENGARLYDDAPVTGLIDRGDDGVEVVVGGADEAGGARESGGAGEAGGARGDLTARGGAPASTYRRFLARRVVLTADAWTNDLLAHLGTSLPLTVTREQVTYFAPSAPERFGADRLPVWIWMDDPSFYGFPTYDEAGNGALVKAAQDCGGAVTSGDGRSFDTDPAALDLLRGFVSGLLPGVGAPAHTVTCLYRLTPDRDFVMGPVPGHPAVLLGLGAGHAFKFAPTFRRVLADLATSGSTSSDISAFAADRPALVDADYPVSWLV